MNESFSLIDSAQKNDSFIDSVLKFNSMLRSLFGKKPHENSLKILLLPIDMTVSKKYLMVIIYHAEREIWREFPQQ